MFPSHNVSTISSVPQLWKFAFSFVFAATNLETCYKMGDGMSYHDVSIR
jgi:hypothetical protein